MNTISFPEFNLVFNISKIAFSIGKIDIYWYAILIVLGIIISLILCSKSKQNYGINFEDFLEVIIFSLVLGIIGARLYYVIFRIDYYKNNLYEIFNIRDGGLAIYGGIISGIITSYIICKKKRIDIIDFFDYSSPYLVLSQAIGRWGNFFNIEAYGNETTSFLRMRIFNESGFIDVHPVFLYESIATLIIFAILRWLQPKRKYQGHIFYTYLLLYSGVRIFLEGMRIDSLMLGQFRISKVLSILVFIYAAFVLLENVAADLSKKYKKIKR